MQCNAMQCMYVCVYACMHACTHACMYVCISFSQQYVYNTRRTYIHTYIYIYIWTPSYCKFLQQSVGQNHTTSSVEQPDAISAGWGYHPRMRMAGRDLRFATATRAGDLWMAELWWDPRPWVEQARGFSSTKSNRFCVRGKVGIPRANKFMCIRLPAYVIYFGLAACSRYTQDSCYKPLYRSKEMWEYLYTEWGSLAPQAR